MWRSLVFILVMSANAWAVECDCEVRVHSPMTGSHQMPPIVIKKYELESFPSITKNSIKQCRTLCQKEFQSDMPAERLNALLITHSMQLIENKTLGYNCTGLTTLKYPVRVRALLDSKGLGNVEDLIQVINHEEVCF